MSRKSRRTQAPSSSSRSRKNPVKRLADFSYARTNGAVIEFLIRNYTKGGSDKSSDIFIISRIIRALFKFNMNEDKDKISLSSISYYLDLRTDLRERNMDFYIFTESFDELGNIRIGLIPRTDDRLTVSAVILSDGAVEYSVYGKGDWEIPIAEGAKDVKDMPKYLSILGI